MATKVIGLAGRPGCGKSAVAGSLSSRAGIEWIDLDRLAWETYHPGTETYEQLVARFGREILGADGTIDRRRLADHVFAQSTGRDDLEAIVHPKVMGRLRHEIAIRQARGVAILLVEGAVLVHSSHVDRSLFDAMIWLEVSGQKRSERLRAAGRSGQATRVPDPHPDRLDGILRLSAEGEVSEVADRLLRLIETV